MKFLIIVLAIFPLVASAESSDVAMETALGPLAGTIVVPDSSDPFAVALIISGSGPTDRNGNTRGLPGNNNSLKLLAESLSDANIASLRYDKRLIGDSASAGLTEEDLRFDMYVADARAWIAFVSERFDLPIYVIGHSEGALIGLLAADSADAAGVISIAGPGKRASNLILEQVSKQLPPDLLIQTEKILNELEEGRTVKSPPPVLNALFRESVQPYLISWFQYDPQAVVAELDKPILLMYGSTDIQVSASDGESLKSSNEKADLIVIQGMNHVLKIVVDDLNEQVRSYSNPSLPIAGEIVPAIVEFIEKQN
jgi:hypothetical protein